MNRLHLIRLLMKAADRIRRRYWRLRGTTIYGVMVLAYAPDGRLLLLRQTYTSGWCLPGGGRRRTEDSVAAGLRELREEVGATSWTTATKLASFGDHFAGVPALIDLIQVENIEFTFKPSLEIEAVALFNPNNLPEDTNSWALRLLKAAEDMRQTGISSPLSVKGVPFQE